MSFILCASIALKVNFVITGSLTHFVIGICVVKKSAVARTIR